MSKLISKFIYFQLIKYNDLIFFPQKKHLKTFFPNIAVRTIIPLVAGEGDASSGGVEVHPGKTYWM